MYTLKRFVDYVVGLISRVAQKRSTTEDIILMWMLGVGIALLIIGALTAHYWFPIALGVGIVLWSIYPTRSKQPITPPVVPMESVYRELFKVLSEIHDRISAVRPIDLHDIAMMPPVVTRSNGIEVIKAKISKASRGDFDEEKLKIVRKIIQARIDDHLRSGRVENIPFASLDNQVPIFWIDCVYDDLATLYIDVIVINTDDKLRYVINSQFAEAAPQPPEPTDEDFQ
jgi:hypothetical protein